MYWIRPKNAACRLPKMAFAFAGLHPISGNCQLSHILRYKTTIKVSIFVYLLAFILILGFGKFRGSLVEIQPELTASRFWLPSPSSAVASLSNKGPQGPRLLRKKPQRVGVPTLTQKASTQSSLLPRRSFSHFLGDGATTHPPGKMLQASLLLRRGRFLITSEVFSTKDHNPYLSRTPSYKRTFPKWFMFFTSLPICSRAYSEGVKHNGNYAWLLLLFNRPKVRFFISSTFYPSATGTA